MSASDRLRELLGGLISVLEETADFQSDNSRFASAGDFARHLRGFIEKPFAPADLRELKTLFAPTGEYDEYVRGPAVVEEVDALIGELMNAGR